MVTEKEAEEKLMYCGRCAHFDLLKEEEMESRVYREAKYTHLDQHLTLADCRKTEKNPSGSIVMKECCLGICRNRENAKTSSDEMKEFFPEDGHIFNDEMYAGDGCPFWKEADV